MSALAKKANLSVALTPRKKKMPPPRRPKSNPQRDAQSVYPPRSVAVPLGGYRSTTLTQGIRCWAKLIEPAALEVAAMFTPAEWRFLAESARGREWDISPEWADPGSHVAQWVERAVNFEQRLDILGKQAREVAGKLVTRLRKLSYLHAWAVIWALQWRCECEGTIQPEDTWWTLGHRQAKLGEQEKTS